MMTGDIPAGAERNVSCFFRQVFRAAEAGKYGYGREAAD